MKIEELALYLKKEKMKKRWKIKSLLGSECGCLLVEVFIFILQNDKQTH